MRYLLALSLIAGCFPTSNSVICDDGRVCPETTVCDDAHQACVEPEQLIDCNDRPDRAPCALRGGVPGTCQQGVCLEASCGNARLDAEDAERCDDGNNASGDGCSGDCASDETCGTGVVDPLNDEVCDDGNLFDHDGCSSKCQEETARWVQLSDLGPLSATAGVYDAARGTVVVFGGCTTPSDATNATSEWNGVWRSRIETVSPPTRDVLNQSSASFGLVYDSARQRTIMFGGSNGDTEYRDLWEWDGVRWTNLPEPPRELEAVRFPAMGYDSKRKRTVLFGGARVGGFDGSTTARNDTWEFDGTTWFKMTPTTRPSERYFASMTFDPRRGVMVLFGGENPSESSELWEYDGVTWTLRLPTNDARRIVLPVLTYDARNNRVVIMGHDAGNVMRMYFWDGTNITPFAGALPVSGGPVAETSVRRGFVLTPDGHGRLMLYGGEATTGQLFTTRLMWFFDGTTWTEADPQAPTNGLYFAMAPQPDRGAIVRVGGENAGSSTADTWELTRRGWTRFPNPSAMPPALIAASMTYDSTRKELVLFGGISGSTAVNQTWIRSGTTWSPRSAGATPPPARYYTSLAFDGARGKAIMFGGADTDGLPLADTWLWDGTAWTQHTATPSPSARMTAAIAYDSTANVVVLFGGSGTDNKALGDTWLWDGTTWTDVTASLDRSPPPRRLGSLTYDPARRSLMLTQSLEAATPGILTDTWEWRSSPGTPAGRWTPVDTSLRPPVRALGGAFPSLDGAGVSLFQGYSSSAGAVGDHWQLRWDGPRASDGCGLQVDIDGDQLIGCDDPDCWRVCQPQCPPLTSCPVDAPRCGDAMCSAAETCLGCRADCGQCSICGDFACDASENISNCPGDCTP